MAFYIRLGNIVGKKENAMFKENHILYDRRIIFFSEVQIILSWKHEVNQIKRPWERWIWGHRVEFTEKNKRECSFYIVSPVGPQDTAIYI